MGFSNNSPTTQSLLTSDTLPGELGRSYSKPPDLTKIIKRITELVQHICRNYMCEENGTIDYKSMKKDGMIIRIRKIFYKFHKGNNNFKYSHRK